MPVPIGTAEAGDLVTQVISTRVAGISDGYDRAGAQALMAFPVGYASGPSVSVAVEGEIDDSDADTAFTARGEPAHVVDMPTPALVPATIGDDRISFFMDRREHYDVLRATAAAGDLTDAAYNYAYRVAAKVGRLHRRLLAKNHKRFDAVVGATANWHDTLSTTLDNPVTNAATLTHTVIRNAFRAAKADTVLMPLDAYDALCDSPDLKKRIHGNGESDQLLDDDHLQAYFNTVAKLPGGRSVRVVVDQFTGDPKDTDYFLGDWLLIFRGGDGTSSVRAPARDIEGVERQHAAAGLFCRPPGDPLEAGAGLEGLGLANLPAAKDGMPGLTDEQRQMLFGMEYIINPEQYRDRNQVQHILNSSYGFKIWDAQGGVLLKGIAGRS